MTLELPARPLPGLRSEMDTRAPLAAEDGFWRGLSCVLDDPTHSPVPATDTAIPRHLVTAGIELRAPAEAACSWLRLELRVGNGWRPLGVFPEQVTEPSGVAGPGRVTPAGRVERDLVPGGTELPAYTIGWVEPDGALVWDVLPATGEVPKRLGQLLILCEGDAGVAPVVRHRLALRLHTSVLGLRVVSFDGEVTSTEGGQLDMEPGASGGVIEPVAVAEPTEAAADVLARMSRADHRVGVLVDGTSIVGVVAVAQLASAPEDAPAAAVAVWPLPVVTVDTTLEEAARMVGADPSVPADLRGAVVVDAAGPVGFISQASLDTLLRGPVVRGGELGNLAGAPVSRLVFECRVHNETATVAYYDPSNPPRCSHGDLMSRRREP